MLWPCPSQAGKRRALGDLPAARVATLPGTRPPRRTFAGAWLPERAGGGCRGRTPALR